jgi:hypothetical protein
MRVRLNAATITSLAASLTTTRSCSACDDGSLVPGPPSSRDMVIWTEKGGFTWSKPHMCCNSRTCQSAAFSAATAHDMLHFFGLKSLAPIAANVVLTAALARSWYLFNYFLIWLLLAPSLTNYFCNYC